MGTACSSATTVDPTVASSSGSRNSPSPKPGTDLNLTVDVSDHHQGGERSRSLPQEGSFISVLSSADVPEATTSTEDNSNKRSGSDSLQHQDLPKRSKARKTKGDGSRKSSSELQNPKHAADHQSPQLIGGDGGGTLAVNVTNLEEPTPAAPLRNPLLSPNSYNARLKMFASTDSYASGATRTELPLPSSGELLSNAARNANPLHSRNSQVVDNIRPCAGSPEEQEEVEEVQEQMPLDVNWDSSSTPTGNKDSRQPNGERTAKQEAFLARLRALEKRKKMAQQNSSRRSINCGAGAGRRVEASRPRKGSPSKHNNATAMVVSVPSILDEIKHNGKSSRHHEEQHCSGGVHCSSGGTATVSPPPPLQQRKGEQGGAKYPSHTGESTAPIDVSPPTEFICPLPRPISSVRSPTNSPPLGNMHPLCPATSTTTTDECFSGESSWCQPSVTSMEGEDQQQHADSNPVHGGEQRCSGTMPLPLARQNTTSSLSPTSSNSTTPSNSAIMVAQSAMTNNALPVFGPNAPTIGRSQQQHQQKELLFAQTREEDAFSADGRSVLSGGVEDTTSMCSSAMTKAPSVLRYRHRRRSTLRHVDDELGQHGIDVVERAGEAVAVPPPRCSASTSASNDDDSGVYGNRHDHNPPDAPHPRQTTATTQVQLPVWTVASRSTSLNGM